MLHQTNAVLTRARCRTGAAPALEDAVALNSAAAAAKTCATGDPAILTRLEALEEALARARTAVAAAFLAGLPVDDPVHLLLHDDGDAHLAAAMGSDYMPPASAELWWAGKEFSRGQSVADRVGRNEKTKVVARLQRPGQGAPLREPVVSEAERAAMMAWYFKKQEADKALSEDREDGYLNASWADSKALKSQLLSTTNIGWKAAR